MRSDRRNDYYRRHLLTELGDIELNVPTRGTRTMIICFSRSRDDTLAFDLSLVPYSEKD